MKRRAIFAILLASPLFAQQLEVASIKPFVFGGQVLGGVHVDGAQPSVAGLPLRDLLGMAYKIKATLITGAEWTATERFDVAATLPAGGTPAQLPEMMQALLADRFQVKTLTKALFAGNVERFADRRIVDMTGLTGQYDFAFDIAPEDYRAMLLRTAVWVGANLPPEAQKMWDASSPAALGDALQQIGLRLDARKAPLDVLLVDDALKTPIAN